MPVPVPTSSTRWRCALCGNLTRFDVQRSTRSREFVHVSLAGEQVVEERSVVADSVDQVTCRWCGRSDSIELVERPSDRAVAGDGARSAGRAVGNGAEFAGLAAGDGAGSAVGAEPAESPAGS
ncbi:MAG TPA: hypothetical protein VLM05_15300 [Mycobacteriales bacterium]|nr:hypothetical protein [Mycobacteriales bacterium]